MNVELERDRDLFLAGLAVQEGLLTQQQFVTAYAHWSAGPTCPLLDYLTDRGLIGADWKDDVRGHLATLADASSVLTETVEEPRFTTTQAATLDVFDGLVDQAPSPNTIPDATVPAVEGGRETVEWSQDANPVLSQPVTSDTAETVDSHASAATIEAQLAPTPSHIKSSPITPPDRGAGRYTRTRVHARGGLGVVWVAEDQSIGREVALKELKPERGTEPRVLARFLEEARITGQLQHPSIVPIYELGTDPGTGAPYYTMRLIRGGTLADNCARFHKERASGNDDPLAFRSLLTAFVSVCQAVGYSHSRGVIHRDLKGQNVVVGDFGEVFVLDWGLAKVVGDGRSEEGAEDRIDANIRVESGLETADGQLMGTPAYMPPEQARGEIAKVNHLSDVYSLGAILYEILAGRPPFQGSTTAELLRRLINGQLIPPRTVNPAAPPALEAICLKAMSKDPTHRYPSALELADDIQRYLADEPVRAYPEPWTTRAARWVKKHKTGVAAAAIVLVTSVVGLAVANVLISRERDRVRAQRELARKAVDDMYTDVAEQWLEDQSDPLQQAFLDRALSAYEAQDADAASESPVKAPITAVEAAPEPRADRVDSVQRSFLDRSLAYYEGFASQLPSDSRSRLEVGQARIRVASILRKLGRTVEAERNYAQAIAALEELLAREPDEPSVRRALAIGSSRYGAMLVSLGKFPEADKHLGRADALLGAIATAPGTLDRDRLEWARVLKEQGERLKLDGKIDDAQKKFRHAIELLTEVTRHGDSGIEARHELAVVQDALGVMLLLALDQQAESTKLLESALNLEKPLVDQAPTIANFRAGLGKTANTLALLLRSEGKTADALSAIETSQVNYERLSSDFPGRPEYRRSLARALLNRGNLEQDEEHIGEAETSYRKASVILSRLVNEAPSVTKHHRDLGKSLINLGAMLQQSERLDEAVDTYRQAEAIAAKLVERFPSVPEYQEMLGINRRNLARVMALRGRGKDSEDALAVGRSALSSFESLVKAYPQIPSYQRGLAKCQLELGTNQILADRKSEAEPTLRRAVETFRALAQAAPDSVTDRRELVEALVNLTEAGAKDAEDRGREAVAMIELLCKTPRASKSDLKTRALALVNLGEIVERNGKTTESGTLLARAAELLEKKGTIPSEAERFHYLAYVHNNQGKLAQRLEHPEEAVKFYRQAIDREEDAGRLESAYKQYLPAAYERLGAVLAAKGDHEATAALAIRLTKALPESSAARLKAAALLGKCVELAQKGTAPSDAERSALAHAYALKGVAQLRVAIDSGSNVVDRIWNNPELRGLIEGPESREILPELLAKARQGG
jgi:serine/threonine protein kinase/tetratricopeptide (TPR) repeat protein